MLADPASGSEFGTWVESWVWGLFEIQAKGSGRRGFRFRLLVFGLRLRGLHTESLRALALNPKRVFGPFLRSGVGARALGALITKNR